MLALGCSGELDDLADFDKPGPGAGLRILAGRDRTCQCRNCFMGQKCAIRPGKRRTIIAQKVVFENYGAAIMVDEKIVAVTRVIALKQQASVIDGNLVLVVHDMARDRRFTIAGLRHILDHDKILSAPRDLEGEYPPPRLLHLNFLVRICPMFRAVCARTSQTTLIV